MTPRTPVYLDCNATTPLDPQVLEAMLPYLREHFGNSASRSHIFGWTAEAAVKLAREHVARLIGATPREIVFTSGATEADNLALKGVALRYRERGQHLICSAIEHPAVLDPMTALERLGWQVTRLPVDGQGLLDPDELRRALRPDTVLCSVMLANNEVGTIQPLRELAAICLEADVFVHCDAAQGLGQLSFDVRELGLDLVSLSAHKMYGPKGIGALFVRRGRPRVGLEPALHGGGHERGLRSGTLPVHQIAGFGEAAELAREALAEGRGIARMRSLRDRLLDQLRAELDGVEVNGSLERRLPNNLNLSFAHVEAEALMLSMRDVAVSSGSACTSASLHSSHVLRAMGVPEDLAHGSIRFGLGRFTTAEEIDYVVRQVTSQVRRLRAASPLSALPTR